MKKPSNGPFGSFINQYLQLRRSLGFILRGAEYTLNKFDLYLSQYFPDAKTVTKPMIAGYLQTGKHLQVSTLYLRFMFLRQFCRFLFQLNPDTYIPEKRLIRRGPTVRLPHIYTTDEAMKLIKLARRCPHRTVENTFLSLIRQLGIRTVQGRNPRLHDFRHTFATRYLNEVYETGKDPNASLPLLATYLGHVKITYTQVYLHPASGLLATAGQRFFEHVHKSDSLLKGGRQ